MSPQRESKIEKILEVLAINMAKSFESIDKRFIAVDKRFSDVDKRFSDIDKRFISLEMIMDQKISGVKSEIESLRQDTNERFDRVDLKLKEINEDISGIVSDYHPHIIALEEKVFGHFTFASE